MANKTSYWLAFIFMILSFIFCAIGFGTGYWFVAKGEGRLFRRLGLWEACFDGFEYTSDYIGKAYFGCWWIFHQEYSYVREWILPSWFIGVQTLMTFGLCLEMIALGLFPGAGTEGNSTRRETMTSVVTFFAFACITVSVCTFGTMIGEDRTWMPEPVSDEPGWSFGLVVVSGFLAAFSCISIITYTMMREWELSNPKQGYSYGTKAGAPSMSMVPRV